MKKTKSINKKVKAAAKSTYFAEGKKLDLKEYALAEKILKLVKKHNNGVIMIALENEKNKVDGIMFSLNTSKPVVKNLVTQAIEYFELVPQNVFDIIEKHKKLDNETTKTD